MAGGAANECFDVEILQELLDFLSCDFVHVLAYEGAPAVVCLIGIPARVVEVIAGNDIDPAGAEAIGETADAAEKVNSPDGGAVVGFYVFSCVDNIPPNIQCFPIETIASRSRKAGKMPDVISIPASGNS